MNPLHFTLTKTSLIRLSCPGELQASVANQRAGLPIVAILNSRALGETKGGYIPNVVVCSGEAARTSLLTAGVVRSWVLMSNKALKKLNASDGMGYDELMMRLKNGLVKKFYGNSPLISAQSLPSIHEVHPFNGYVVYSMNGSSYCQSYVMDHRSREATFPGLAINADGDARQFMPRVQTGVRYAYAPMKGNNQSMTQGGAMSELVTCIIRNLANIEQSAAAYVAATKTGLSKPMRPAFYPVNLSEDGKIMASLVAQGIDPFEFARWCAASVDRQSKTTVAISTIA